MKILLINPPLAFYPGSSPTTGGLPLGLLYIAAVLDKNGYKCQILDALMTDQRDCLNKGARYKGMDWSMIQGEIVKAQPDVVGITNPFSVQIENAIEVASIVK